MNGTSSKPGSPTKTIVRAAAFDHGVRRDRGSDDQPVGTAAVHELLQARRRSARAGSSGVDGTFAVRSSPSASSMQYEIGERPSGVDADADAHRLATRCTRNARPAFAEGS